MFFQIFVIGIYREVTANETLLILLKAKYNCECFVFYLRVVALCNGNSLRCITDDVFLRFGSEVGTVVPKVG